MKLQDLDFSKCMFDPMKENTWKKLLAYPEFKQQTVVAKKTVVPYIILMYDPASPLWREEPSWAKRKRVSMELLGYKVDHKTNEFPKNINEIVLDKNNKVNAMIVRYSKLSNSIEYLQLVFYNHIFSHLYSQSLGLIERPESMAKAMITVGEKIREKQELVFGDFVTKNLEYEIYKDVDNERDDMKAENVAGLLAKGDKLEDFNPYKDYDVTQSDNDVRDKAFKFIGDE